MSQSLKPDDFGKQVFIVAGVKRTLHIGVRRFNDQLLTGERCNLDAAKQRQEYSTLADAASEGFQRLCDRCLPDGLPDE